MKRKLALQGCNHAEGMTWWAHRTDAAQRVETPAELARRNRASSFNIANNFCRTMLSHCWCSFLCVISRAPYSRWYSADTRIRSNGKTGDTYPRKPLRVAREQEFNRAYSKLNNAAKEIVDQVALRSAEMNQIVAHLAREGFTEPNKGLQACNL